jgi:hypothetical protein
LQLVHLSTVENVRKVMAHWDQLGAAKGCEIPMVENITKMTLAVISEAGFGKQFHLYESSEEPTGSHKMGFHQAFEVLSHHFITKHLVPSFLLKIGPTKSLRDCGLAFSEFDQYMNEIVNGKKNNPTDESTDLLSLLVKGNRLENPAKAVTDS